VLEGITAISVVFFLLTAGIEIGKRLTKVAQSELRKARS